jgi:hypothetical protein
MLRFTLSTFLLLLSTTAASVDVKTETEQFGRMYKTLTEDTHTFMSGALLKQPSPNKSVYNTSPSLRGTRADKMFSTLADDNRTFIKSKEAQPLLGSLDLGSGKSLE